MQQLGYELLVLILIVGPVGVPLQASVVLGSLA